MTQSHSSVLSLAVNSVTSTSVAPLAGWHEGEGFMVSGRGIGGVGVVYSEWEGYLTSGRGIGRVGGV